MQIFVQFWIILTTDFYFSGIVLKKFHSFLFLSSTWNQIKGFASQINSITSNWKKGFCRVSQIWQRFLAFVKGVVDKWRHTYLNFDVSYKLKIINFHLFTALKKRCVKIVCSLIFQVKQINPRYHSSCAPLKLFTVSSIEYRLHYYWLFITKNGLMFLKYY